MWSSRSGAAWTACAALVGLVGCALLWVALTGPSTPPQAPAVATSSPVTSSPVTSGRAAGTPPPATPHRARHHGVADRTRGLLLGPARPVRVTIPRLHVASALVGLGVDRTGAMEVPPDPDVAGWFRLGPTPGALGPAVIAGHVTWNGAPGVFFDLARLRAGDVVRVDRTDHREAVFTVDRVARFDKRHFPTGAVFGAADHAALRLITCGGTYDAARHRYLDNVVAFASLVGSRTPAR